MVGELSLRSPAFEAGEAIPTRFTADGPNISPPLEWDTPPDNTASIVLICEDTDAPGRTWCHWVLYNVPADQTSLREDIPKRAHLESGARQGRNDFGGIGYGGPSPPEGSPHHYNFRLFFLDGSLDIMETGLTRQQVLNRMENHVLGRAALMGTYHR